MTVADILEQAKALSVYERKELAKLLIDSLDVGEPMAPRAKTGAEIVSMLDAIDPIELVDPHIEDPVEWVETQRRKDADRLNLYLENDHD